MGILFTFLIIGFISTSENINNFYYDEEKIFTFNEFRYRRKREKPKSIKLLKPEQCNFNIYYEYDKVEYKINIDLSYVLDHNNNIVKMMESCDCNTYDTLLSKIVATCDNKEALISFIDSARADIKKDYDETKKCSNETMRIFYYRKDYWSLLSKSPKRPIDTIYLKEGQRDSIITYINDFFSTTLCCGLRPSSGDMIAKTPFPISACLSLTERYFKKILSFDS